MIPRNQHVPYARLTSKSKNCPNFFLEKRGRKIDSKYKRDRGTQQILVTKLFDIPIIERRFTWYRENDIKNIDRILMSQDQCMQLTKFQADGTIFTVF